MDKLDIMMVLWFIFVSIFAVIIISERKKEGEQIKGDKEMVKICKFDGCNEEIADWQDLCPRHFAITQQQKQQSNIRQDTPQPQQQESYIQQPKQQEQTVETVKNTQKQSFKISELEERERLIVKQSSMKSAIEFLQRTPIEYQDYDDMIDQLRRLTVDIYKIVVERNEGM